MLTKYLSNHGASEFPQCLSHLNYLISWRNTPCRAVVPPTWCAVEMQRKPTSLGSIREMFGGASLFSPALAWEPLCDRKGCKENRRANRVPYCELRSPTDHENAQASPLLPVPATWAGQAPTPHFLSTLRPAVYRSVCARAKRLGVIVHTVGRNGDSPLMQFTGLRGLSPSC